MGTRKAAPTGVNPLFRLMAKKSCGLMSPKPGVVPEGEGYRAADDGTTHRVMSESVSWASPGGGLYVERELSAPRPPIPVELNWKAHSQRRRGSEVCLTICVS